MISRSAKMRRTRNSQDMGTTGIPKFQRRRTASVDSSSRGSYLPTNRRSSSLERFRQSGKQLLRTTPMKSSIGNPNGRGSLLGRKILKEMRPLADKSYQKQCIAAIVEYLESCHFPYVISPTNLLNPTKKDFENIFQFLYNSWDPRYEVNKIEDEAPKLMKALGYPFSLTKSSFLSITRMSWPTLLGILVWLMNMNKCKDSIDIGTYLSCGDFEKTDEHAILVDYILTSFETGVQDAETDEEVFRNLINKRYCTDQEHEEVDQQIAHIRSLIIKEQEEQDYYNKMTIANEGMASDILSYGEFIAKMNDHIKMKTVLYDELKGKTQAKESDLKSLKEKVAEQEAIYKNQGFDGEQAQNLYAAQKSNLSELLVQKRAKFKAEEKAFWGCEIEVSQEICKVMEQSSKFNHLWERCRTTIGNAVVPLKDSQFPPAKKLFRDYKISLREFQMGPKVTEDIRGTLEHTKKYIEEQRKKAQDLLTSIKSQNESLDTKAQDLDGKLQLMSARQVAKEREIEEKTKQAKQKIESLQQESKDLEEKFDEHVKERTRLEELEKKLKKSIDSCKLKLQEDENMLEKEKKAADDFLQTAHKAMTESYQKIEDERKTAEESLEKLQDVVNQCSS